MSNANIADSEVGALIAGIKANTETKVITLPTDLSTDAGPKEINIIVHSRGDQGVELKSIKGLINEYRVRPERPTGMSSHNEIESFCEHANRFKETNSVCFAQRDQLNMLSIYDYHEGYGKAWNMAHRAIFDPKTSRQMQIWVGSHATMMSQGDFANFIENNVLDICAPPTGSQERPSDEIYAGVAKTLNTTIASPSKLLELARGISINENAVAKSHVNTDTGAMSLEYTTSHADGNGKKLSVPGLFLIGIPIFEGGELYRILVRLRFRLTEGKVKWWYELYQHEKSIDDAFEEIVEKVKEETGLQIYRGTPEN